MSPTGAAFGSEQIIPASAFVEMRRFGEAERCAWENIFSFAYELVLFDRVFLQHDPGEAIVSRPVIPKHVHEILAAIVVVKQRWIEAAAVEENGIRPIAINAWAGDEIVGNITHRRTSRPVGAGV